MQFLDRAKSLSMWSPRTAVDTSWWTPRGGGQRADLSREVMVLGQNELEEIASDGPSRLNLLDLRMGVAAVAPDRGEAATLTGELFDIRTRFGE